MCIIVTTSIKRKVGFGAAAPRAGLRAERAPRAMRVGAAAPRGGAYGGAGAPRVGTDITFIFAKIVENGMTNVYIRKLARWSTTHRWSSFLIKREATITFKLKDGYIKKKKQQAEFRFNITSELETRPVHEKMAERPCIYELKGKKMFNTYPQCPLPKQIAFDLCRQILGENLQHYIIAEELHKNGDKHLHCYLELAEPIRTRNPRYFDLSFPLHLPGVIDTYHGNY